MPSNTIQSQLSNLTEMKISNSPVGTLNLDELFGLLLSMAPEGCVIERVEPCFKRWTDGFGMHEIDHEEFIGLKVYFKEIIDEQS